MKLFANLRNFAILAGLFGSILAIQSIRINKLQSRNATLKMQTVKMSIEVDSLEALTYGKEAMYKDLTQSWQTTLDSLKKRNQKLESDNKNLNGQIDHFFEVAPCKAKLKQGLFKRKDWVLIDCETNKIIE